MNKTAEALKMAIEAFRNIGIKNELLQPALDACKEALASHSEALESQEPVIPTPRWSKEKEMIESWQDKEDEWSKDIEAHHPINTKAFADWDVAQRMVSNRHSKHDLTALVCWLLQTNKNDAQPLTDDEIVSNAEKSGFTWHETKHGHKFLIAPAEAEMGDGYFAIEDELKRFARAIEAAHGIGVKDE